MKYLIEYKNKWGDMIRQASTAVNDAGAFEEADTVTALKTKNTFVGVYRAIERPEPATPQGPNTPETDAAHRDETDAELDRALEEEHGGPAMENENDELASGHRDA